ncbi:hypothetical protein L2E82_40545 [Cichorium intybus]|uniref:Uncharacterized protein n=1 Tax=Cichorium intybus TaxID=13427 RepID=A0ACB9AM24_CICIN|nr:hypothetical protein L2E82_40545 [Cichorium intybus]
MERTPLIKLRPFFFSISSAFSVTACAFFKFGDIQLEHSIEEEGIKGVQLKKEAARKTVPVEKLEEKALVALAKVEVSIFSLSTEGNFKPSKSQLHHAFLLQLLFWFKQTFNWVNSPPCEGCGNENANKGMGTPNSSETAYGTFRVELYRVFSFHVNKPVPKGGVVLTALYRQQLHG